MALRVLLADESTTIKKVMQLALQDFAVEVKAVHVGVDVVEVARQFQPDIIFADVLLQKKNGYEVCADLKNDPQLKSIPVVLMWSSFMDLDEQLAQNSGADRRLEKPFDIEHLRQLLLELVPRTHTQRLAHFLKFPASFSEPMKKEEAAKELKTDPVIPPPPKPTVASGIAPGIATSMPMPPPSSQTKAPPSDETVTRVAEKNTSPNWNMDSFDDIATFEIGEADAPMSIEEDDDDDDESFSELRLQGQPQAPIQNAAPASSTAPVEDSDETWSHQDLSRFKVDLPPVTASNPEFGIDLELPDPSIADLTRETRPFGKPIAPGIAAEEKEPFAYQPPGRSLADNSLLLRPEEIEDATLDVDLKLDEPPGLSLTSIDDEMTEPARGRETATEFPVDEVGRIPQLSPERLEQIIRAQTREIVESVVRRIVPDLATDIIREELQRLLEDTSVRETRR